MMPSSHLILCRPLLLLPPIPPSIRVFPNESTLCMRWPKYWSFSFSNIPSKEHPGLISFRMDWLDLHEPNAKVKHLCGLSFLANLISEHALCTYNFKRPMWLTGGGNGTPLQYSCLENPMDGGAWWAAVYGVAQSRTLLSDFTFTFHFHALEKEMAIHSSVLAWRIPGTAEPGGLPSVGSHRVRHDWSDLAAAMWLTC